MNAKSSNTALTLAPTELCYYAKFLSLEEKSESLLQSLMKFGEDRSIICTQSIENTNIVKYMAK